MLSENMSWFWQYLTPMVVGSIWVGVILRDLIVKNEKKNVSRLLVWLLPGLGLVLYMISRFGTTVTTMEPVSFKTCVGLIVIGGIYLGVGLRNLWDFWRQGGEKHEKVDNLIGWLFSGFTISLAFTYLFYHSLKYWNV